MKKFQINLPTEKKLQKGLKNFLIQVVHIQPHETCLILSNPPGTPSFTVASLLLTHAKNMTQHANMIITTERDLQDPMENVVQNALFSGVNIVIQTNAREIGSNEKGIAQPYDFNGQKFSNPLYYLKAAKKLRAFWFYVDDLKSFADCFTVDFENLRKLSTQINQRIYQAKKVYITSPNGTDFSISMQIPHRKPHADYDGTQHLPGGGANLPLGEIFITPDMSSVEGTFVIDGSFNTVFPWTTIIPKKPITLHFKNGLLIKATGGPEAELIANNIQEAENQTKKLFKEKKLSQQLLKTYIKNNRSIGELAIGVNQHAQIVGNLMIDEKRYADAHIAIGRSYDGDPALLHMDCITKHPRIVFEYINGKKELIAEKGEFYFKLLD